jgi:hypothetical protein
VAALADRLTPALAPIAPSLDAAATFVPALSLAAQPLSGFLLVTAALLLILHVLDGISRGGSRKMLATAGSAFVGGLMIAGLGAAEGIGAWLGNGALTGATLLVLYGLTVRFGPAWVPAFVATMAIMGEVQLLLLWPHAGALLGPAAAIVLLGTAALLWSRSLQSRAAGPC